MSGRGAQWPRPAAVALLGALVAACSKPDPPLLSPGIDGMTGGARGLYEDRPAGTTLPLMRILTDDGVRQQLAARLPATLTSTAGQAEATVLGDLGAPSADCAPRQTTQVCVIYLGATPSPASGLSVAQPTLAGGIIRFDAPYGADDMPPMDTPFPAPGDVIHGQWIHASDSNGRSYMCRSDTLPTAGVQRRVCSQRWGSLKLTVAHDVFAQGDATAIDVAEDPVLDRLFKAGQVYVAAAVASDPQLWRTFAVRGEPSRGPTLSGGATTVWAMVTSQAEWDAACQAAATARQPMLIYSLEDRYDPYATLADARWSTLADKAVLIAVVAQTPIGADPWARAFNNAIGVKNGATITVTGLPTMSGGACRVTRGYQSPAGYLDLNGTAQAVTDARPS